MKAEITQSQENPPENRAAAEEDGNKPRDATCDGCDTTSLKPKPEQAAWSAASTDTQLPLLPPPLAASASAVPTNSAYFILKI
ncbi:hypothetical protein M422DRAFT_261183 [Sphaerobolus stellatus SS14]|uniref:Unplaced genomic scaffold SPHSTscaffold_103, whole genome shotgun sequence n=1 Tax=Sphaerobolus stellatus (strain SS14) TaxID=990650 RepID=A0A0C9V3Z7_SPHS4|nr:hypothetical protein M422DRAFT_261183 [Sphaerobolus stellatus SS14]